MSNTRDINRAVRIPANTPPIEKDGEVYHLSAPFVTKSASGFYIGTVAVHVGGEYHGLVEPYDRLSSRYYATPEDAADELTRAHDIHRYADYQVWDGRADLLRRCSEAVGFESNAELQYKVTNMLIDAGYRVDEDLTYDAVQKFQDEDTTLVFRSFDRVIGQHGDMVSDGGPWESANDSKIISDLADAQGMTADDGSLDWGRVRDFARDLGVRALQLEDIMRLDSPPIASEKTLRVERIASAVNRFQKFIAGGCDLRLPNDQQNQGMGPMINAS